MDEFFTVDTLDILDDFKAGTKGLPVEFLVSEVCIKVILDGIDCGAVIFSNDKPYAAVIAGLNKGIYECKTPRGALVRLINGGIDEKVGNHLG